MNKINAIIILGFSFSYSFSQNVYDAEHLLKFADHLYNNQEYFLAINEYKHAAFLGIVIAIVSLSFSIHI
jgi:uncharacterized membrane protein YkgB